MAKDYGKVLPEHKALESWALARIEDLFDRRASCMNDEVVERIELMGALLSMCRATSEGRLYQSGVKRVQRVKVGLFDYYRSSPKARALALGMR